MRAIHLLLIVVVGSSQAFAGPALTLKRYVGIKIKPWNTGLQAERDPDGNLYLAGHTAASEFDTASQDWFVAKFDAAGIKLWHRTYNGQGNGRDTLGDLEVDTSGNVILCGTAKGLTFQGNVAVAVKWDASGVRKWVRISNGLANATNDHDSYANVETDPSGNVFLAGDASTASRRDMSVEKLTPAGAVLWRSTWDQDDKSESASHLALNSNGTVYVAGNAPTTEQTGALWVYSSTGNLLKFHRFDGNGQNGSTITSLTYQGGRVAVTGSLSGTGWAANERIPFSCLFNPGGGLLYLRLLAANSTIDRLSKGGGMAADGTFGNIATTSVMGATTDTMTQLILYRPNGTYQGLATVNLPVDVFAYQAWFANSFYAMALYGATSGGNYRLFACPVEGGKLQSSRAVALTLAGQVFEPPIRSGNGGLLVPYSQNGIAGLRYYLPAGEASAWFGTRPLFPDQTIRVLIDPGKTGPTRYFLVSVYHDGSILPVYEMNHAVPPIGGIKEIQVNLKGKGVKAGQSLRMVVQEVNVNGTPLVGGTVLEDEVDIPLP